MTDRRKKLVMGGLAAGAAFVIASSAAYACVPFRGKVQVNVSGNGTIQNTSTVEGDGSANNHVYCGFTANPGLTTATNGKANGGNVITVAINPATTSGCVANPKLSNKNHSVIINNAKTDAAQPFTFLGGTSWSFINGTGCFKSPAPVGNITLDTAFAVDSAGAGTKTYTLPALNRADGTNAASALCVGTATTPEVTGEGIFVPITIINPAVI